MTTKNVSLTDHYADLVDSLVAMARFVLAPAAEQARLRYEALLISMLGVKLKLVGCCMTA